MPVVADQPAGDQRPPCGCVDTKTKIITVLSGSGPTIDLDCCYGTVCAGDTSSFCTSVACSTYTWTVTGGNIISGLGTNCIKVKWFPVYSGPTTVSLAVPGCGAAPCAGTTTLNVPVLYPNLPITGTKSVVCRRFRKLFPAIHAGDLLSVDNQCTCWILFF